MREDIEEFWNEIAMQIVKKKILSILQSRNALPKKQTYNQIATAKIEAAWPANKRTETKKRLTNPNSWPKKYNSSQTNSPFTAMGVNL